MMFATRKEPDPRGVVRPSQVAACAEAPPPEFGTTSAPGFSTSMTPTTSTV